MAISDIKDLQDIIFLFLGFFLLVQGTRIFLDREKKTKPTEVLMALLFLVMGLFIASMWYSSIRHGVSLANAGTMYNRANFENGAFGPNN
jgi:hypothetical protein